MEMNRAQQPQTPTLNPADRQPATASCHVEISTAELQSLCDAVLLCAKLLRKSLLSTEEHKAANGNLTAALATVATVLKRPRVKGPSRNTLANCLLASVTLNRQLVTRLGTALPPKLWATIEHAMDANEAVANAAITQTQRISNV